MIVGRRILVWLCFAVLLCAATLLVFTRRQGPASVSSGQRLRRIVASYQQRGLLVDNVLDGVVLREVSTAQYPFRPNPDELRSLFANDEAGEPRTLTQEEFLGELLDIFTRDEKMFAGKTQINKLPTADKLTILFVAEDPADLAGSRNCAYIGTLNTIVCNAQYIKRRFETIDQISEFHSIIIINSDKGKSRPVFSSEMQFVRDRLKSDFFIWLLGHEIGHAVKHRGIQSPHELNGAELAGTGYDEREIEADDFVAEKLLKAHRGEASWAAVFVLSLTELMEHDYRTYVPQAELARLQAEGVREVAGHYPIKVPFDRFNLPEVVRLIRITEAIARQPGIDASRHHVLAKAGITLINSSVPPTILWPIILVMSGGGVLLLRRCHFAEEE